MSLSVQEPEAAGSSGARGWVEQIAKLALESCGKSVGGIIRLREKKTSSRGESRCPSSFQENEMKFKSATFMQTRGEDTGVITFSVCALQQDATRHG